MKHKRNGSVRVKAPLLGVFYASPGPESPLYVRVGEHVRAGQIIGLIEAMKVVNEIEAPVAGTVQRVMVKSGSLVDLGKVLVTITPD
jgi:acetyl-CoA carboxylase biotin carboxyl carrier protein